MTNIVRSQLISAEAFDKTLKKFAIKGAELSRASGVTAAVISEFRKGKANPSTAVVEKLIDAMEQLQPGSWQFFYTELAAAKGTANYTDIASQLDAIANQLRDIPQFHGINVIAS